MKYIILSFFALGMLCIYACNNPSETTENKELTDMKTKPGFFHNVYFFINPDATTEDITRFEKGLDNLGKIEVLIDYHIGKPAMTPRDVVDNSYQYAIVTSFKNKEDHDVYQVHPIHDEFRKEIEGIVDSVRIYDSIIE